MADERGKSNFKETNADPPWIQEVKQQDATDKKCSPSFLYNGRFCVLAFLCSLPLLYFGGERLFGIGTICLLAVYLLHVSFSDTKSSVIGYVISMVIMQFCILYSVGPLLWRSFFNLFLLLIYNVFIVLTGGLGLIQFENFRKDELAFCASVEYFLFLLYPPTCLFILVWICCLAFGVHLAPYLFTLLGFPICHAFLDPRMKCSFVKSDCVLGLPEQTLAILNFIFSPSISYCLVNFSYFLHYSSWVAMFFCLSVPSFLVTFLDTSDIRDTTDIRNEQWQKFQVVSGCISLITGNVLIYVHGVVDGLRAVFIGIILLCSTAVFVAVKYRYSQMISYIACGFLLATYICWLSLLPWSLVFSMGSTIRLSFFTVEVLISVLGVISVFAISLSTSIRYRSFLNHILVFYSFGFVIVEGVLVESSSYSIYMMIFTSVPLLYMIQRLYRVGRLNKTCSLVCISLHGSKLLLLVSSSSPYGTVNGLSFIITALGGFCFCCTVTNVMMFEHGKYVDRHKAVTFGCYFFLSLTTLSPTFLRALWSIMTHVDPSTADACGVVLGLTGMFLAKIAFFHMDDEFAKKQSLAVFVFGILLIVLQPYFNILEVAAHFPKIIFREVFYETWQVVLAEYLILPWCLVSSLTILFVLLLKLLPLKELSSLSFYIMSGLIGAPLGLYFAHKILPYPEIASSFLSIPYVLSTFIATYSLLLAFRGSFPVTNLKMYFGFLFVSMTSVAMEIFYNITINILQASVPPSIVFQGILHLMQTAQLHEEYELQTSLDLKKSMLSNVPCNISSALLFMCGLWFAPSDYYDILLVPVCGCLLLLQIRDLNFTSVRKSKRSVNRFIFTVVLGLILYYRVLRQLPLGKTTFWVVLGFIMELSVVITTLPVFVVIASIFWKQKMSRTEELTLAFLAPVFTLLLFYGRTSAGQVLGFTGPSLAYYTFYFPSR